MDTSHPSSQLPVASLKDPSSDPLYSTSSRMNSQTSLMTTMTAMTNAHERSTELFNKNCKKCGCLPSYADDAVYVISNVSRTLNQERIIMILDRITSFLNSNRLSINQSKTVIQEFMLKQKRCKIKGEPPTLQTLTDKGESKEVKVMKSNILLGGTLQNDLKWRAHLESGEEPMLSNLRKKLGALKHLSKNIPRKSRLFCQMGSF